MICLILPNRNLQPIAKSHLDLGIVSNERRFILKNPSRLWNEQTIHSINSLFAALWIKLAFKYLFVKHNIYLHSLSNIHTWFDNLNVGNYHAIPHIDCILIMPWHLLIFSVVVVVLISFSETRNLSHRIVL